jgi:Flp pilus assembly protein TadB
VEWMLLAGLGIMWTAFLVPWGRRKSTESRSVNDFEHRMELLANAEVHGTTGRWIVTPRKGVRFLGPDDRRRARARDRRRKIFVALLEVIVLSFLIGLVPPLRQVWYVTAGLGAVLLLYVWALLSMKGRSSHAPRQVQPAARMEPVTTPSFAVAAPSASEEPFDFEDEPVHVVVREASVGV